MLFIGGHMYALLYVADARSLRVMPYGGRTYRYIAISGSTEESRRSDRCTRFVLELVLNKVRTCFPFSSWHSALAPLVLPRLESYLYVHLHSNMHALRV